MGQRLSQIDDVREPDAEQSGEPVSGQTAEPVPNRATELVRLLKLTERREPAVIEVATWVGLGIIEGRLRPGEDLNSVELSHRFNSSRTPVREALMLLEQEGLVEIRARRRPRVAAFTPQRVREIYYVRGHLLGLVGQLVAEHASDDDLADLRERLGEMQERADAGDIDDYFWRHVALQERMTDIGGNETLKGILDSLALRTLILRHASLAQPGRLRASVADQVRIIEAIEQRDGELAAMLLLRATHAALAAIEAGGWSERSTSDEDG
ncbi:GntR family transcriptional regulator [Nonomuraea sp. NPDC026600]|uniref:GntR family transcriptional regulator n=1 Tax=Nonomuraea sp. NPDC026600 TaxID=3155363 RepID=UPI0033EE6E43